ncbi:hypothetical protein K469DRAFT_689715 [Zopfia rhizophila CBS 207.26]|uniref:Mid2 domain-containing protein n=1 Tax=Zopfia rhizophila CBS 207.26 TaxID=1314779 RepID=A0A6A6DYX8_9PEZI|nr:hypothetical protein K469DRAFT_689715 [Zopfia rhizophila CBS 207.26]
MTPLLFLFLICLLFATYCVPQETVQSVLWNVPAGSKGDFYNTFSAGQSVPLSWNAYPDNASAPHDLWVTTYDYQTNPYSIFILANVDLSQSGSFTWTINITDSQLQHDAKYVLRFKPLANPRTFYDVNFAELSSPGILILRGAASSTSSIASITTMSSTSTSSVSSTATSAPSSAPASSPSGPPGGLGTSAKVGIGVGVAAGALATIAAGIVLFFRRRKRNVPQPESYTAPVYEKQAGIDAPQYPSGLCTVGELSSQPELAELSGHYGQRGSPGP